MPKRVYIAGPITKGNLDNNVNQATGAFIKLAKAGFAPMCPHWSVFSSRVENGVAVAKVQPNIVSYSEWLSIDMAWISVSDALLRLPGESEGADAEVRYALSKQIPVFFNLTSLVKLLA